MRKLLTFILLSLITKAAFSQVNESWVKKDSIFINQVVNSIQNNSEKIYNILDPNEKYLTPLGYGFYSLESSTGKGYVSFFFQLVFKKDTLISYKITAQSPNIPSLVNRYNKFYSPIFKINESDDDKVYYWNFDRVSAPIDGKPNADIIIKSDLKFFMSPYSGIEYGGYGIHGKKLENRILFEKLAKNFNRNLIEYCLKSINPASRLYAAEYYYKNEKDFGKENNLSKLISDMLHNTPEVYTYSVDVVYQENAKKLLNLYINENLNK